MKILRRIELRDGMEVVIRSPKRNDAVKALRYINTLVKETPPPMILADRTYNLKEERKVVKEILDDIKKKKSVFVVAEFNGKIIGTCGIKQKEMRRSHLGELGIAVLRDFRGKGLGKEMMSIVIDNSKETIKGLKKLRLDVYADNKNAMRLYKKFGFRVIARLPKDIKWGKIYMDAFLMEKRLK